MKYQFFTIPVSSYEDVQEKLNNFCATHKVATVEKQFVSNNEQSFWAFCITYIEGDQSVTIPKKSRIDYKEILDEKDFAIFAKLRNLRKKMAEKEGVPLYGLFTNDQMATMIQKRITTISGMRTIDGVGDVRIEKYAKAFIDVLKEEMARFGSGSKNETQKN